MNALRLLAVGLLLTGLGAGASGEEKKEGSKEKLVGLWEVAKADPNTMPVGSTMELMKDGKAKLTMKEGGQEMSLMASYTLADGKLTLTAKVGGEDKNQALLIKKLTATELVVTDDKGKSVEFKRKK